MKPPNFRIAKVRCCYTCINATHGDELIECKYYYDYSIYPKTKTHYGISPIGKCKYYKQRKDIDFASNVLMNDNISNPE